MLIAVALALAVAAAAEPPRERQPALPASLAVRSITVESLGWLAGRWRTPLRATPRSGPHWTEEIWTEPAAGMMLGMGRSQQGFGRMSFEHLRIAADPAGILYYASPNGGAAVAFRLTGASAGHAVFENSGHDYPQRIVYRRDRNRLTAIISLADGSRPYTIRYQRQ